MTEESAISREKQMAKNNKIEMIPVSRDTESMLKYVGCTYETMPDGTEYWKWVQNFLWSDTIVVDRIERGQSSAHFIIYSEISGKEYCMFMKDLLDLIKKHTVENGRISGCFTYCKRGQNYGIKIV